MKSFVLLNGVIVNSDGISIQKVHCCRNDDFMDEKSAKDDLSETRIRLNETEKNAKSWSGT